MKYFLVFLLLTGLKNEKVLWEKIKNFYLNLKTLSGQFLQRECDEESGVCVEYRGKFYIKKPYYLRLEITEPEDWLVISDKESIYFYYQKDSLYQKLSIKEFNPFLIFFTFTQDTLFPIIKEKDKKYYLLEFPFKDYRLNLRIRKKELMIDKIDYQWKKKKLEIYLFSQKLNKVLADTLFIKK
ncbi:MAG: outer membrane lipoprotein carrier protein LolA [candidate division WOR-3 bacterium]|uniref:Outer membrane lipoprotein carrier protein LolA n=1 Tax=candidate division WOR-3 bacterium TaxID=2052148 RepID=A0A7C4S120_UNCW3